MQFLICRPSRSSTRTAPVRASAQCLFFLSLLRFVRARHDATGSIDIGEIRHILTNLGERMSDDEVSDLQWRTDAPRLRMS
jgi:hypothetical protein